MIHRLVPLAGFLVGLALSLVNCSPVSSCSASNCLGCCDANGRCAPGNTPTGCGKDGVACVSCGMGQQCISNNCAVVLTGGGSSGTGGGTSGMGGGTSGTGGGTSGTGGGTSGTGGGTSGTGGGTSGTGGGTSGGGGGSSGTGGGTGCQNIPSYDLNGVEGRYRLSNSGQELAWEVRGFAPIAGTVPQTYTTINVALFHPIGNVPTIPLSGTIPANVRNSTCVGCINFSVGCSSPGGPCLGKYLAISGNYTVTSATANFDAGVFVGQATDVLLQGWDFQADMPISSQPCIHIDTIRWNSLWP